MYRNIERCSVVLETPSNTQIYFTLSIFASHLCTCMHAHTITMPLEPTLYCVLYYGMDFGKYSVDLCECWWFESWMRLRLWMALLECGEIFSVFFGCFMWMLFILAYKLPERTPSNWFFVCTSAEYYEIVVSICQLHQKAHRKTDNKFNSKTFRSCSFLLVLEKYFSHSSYDFCLTTEPPVLKSKCKFSAVIYGFLYLHRASFSLSLDSSILLSISICFVIWFSHFHMAFAWTASNMAILASINSHSWSLHVWCSGTECDYSIAFRNLK